jgi:hypothetical protein
MPTMSAASQAAAVQAVMRNAGVSVQTAARGFAQFGEAIRQVGAALKRLTRSLGLDTPEGRLRWQRATHGGNGTDARTWPGEWQSASCSAWLHESCPSDQHGLGCTCGCHRRTP